jgi:hypothetical protein
MRIEALMIVMREITECSGNAKAGYEVTRQQGEKRTKEGRSHPSRGWDPRSDTSNFYKLLGLH